MGTWVPAAAVQPQRGGERIYKKSEANTEKGSATRDSKIVYPGAIGGPQRRVHAAEGQPVCEEALKEFEAQAPNREQERMRQLNKGRVPPVPQGEKRCGPRTGRPERQKQRRTSPGARPLPSSAVSTATRIKTGTHKLNQCHPRIWEATVAWPYPSWASPATGMGGQRKGVATRGQ